MKVPRMKSIRMNIRWLAPMYILAGLILVGTDGQWARGSEDGASGAAHAETPAGMTAHAAPAEHGSDPNPLAIDLDLAIWTGVVFLVLLAVLRKFAWPAISSALEDREKNIEQNIAGAAAKNEEARELLVAHEAKLATANNEVRALLEAARRDAEQTKLQIIEEAKKGAEAERDRAVREVELATDEALKRLAETSANLVVELAGKVVRTNITSEQQSQLVRDALAQLTQSSPSEN
jgi:F-type H+-transporting ATPase subunit b